MPRLRGRPLRPGQLLNGTGTKPRCPHHPPGGCGDLALHGMLLPAVRSRSVEPSVSETGRPGFPFSPEPGCAISRSFTSPCVARPLAGHLGAAVRPICRGPHCIINAAAQARPRPALHCLSLQKLLHPLLPIPPPLPVTQIFSLLSPRLLAAAAAGPCSASMRDQ